MIINDIIKFGKYNWRILDVKGDNILIITQDIISFRSYDLYFAGEVWENCTLREYLNDDFLSEFTVEEQERILEKLLPNNYNPWYGTFGGGDTYDKIFLLSIEEAYKYFGGGGDFPKCEEALVDECYMYSDAHDGDRKAKYMGEFAFWWLRSPGSQCDSSTYNLDDTEAGYAAFVSRDGHIGVYGLDLYGILEVGGVGVRPALWLKID